MAIRNGDFALRTFYNYYELSKRQFSTQYVRICCEVKYLKNIRGAIDVKVFQAAVNIRSYRFNLQGFA
jgi:hypothetical protein